MQEVNNLCTDSRALRAEYCIVGIPRIQPSIFIPLTASVVCYAMSQNLSSHINIIRDIMIVILYIVYMQINMLSDDAILCTVTVFCVLTEKQHTGFDIVKRKTA